MATELPPADRATRHSAPEIDARPETPYPSTSHPSVHDNPLAQKSVHELRQLLDEKKVDYKGLVEKVPTLSNRNSCVDNSVRMTSYRSASTRESSRLTLRSGTIDHQKVSTC